MNKEHFQLKHKWLLKIKKALSILLVITLSFGWLSLQPLQAVTAGVTLGTHIMRVASCEGARSHLGDLGVTQEQLDFFEKTRADRHIHGLVGFEGEYALPDDGQHINVIIIFQSNPAKIQVIEAMSDGYFVTFEEAEQNIEDEHVLFRQELSALFSNYGIMPMPSNYSLNYEYRKAFNGVALTVPANMVEEVANFHSVSAIIPDVSIYIPEPAPTAVIGDPFGMRQGRIRMNAHELHQRGFTGEGVVIAVIDSGLDWQHPAFAGTFLTIEEMQQRNPSITNAHGINIGGTYYFKGRDFIRLWSGGGGNDIRGNPTGLPAGEPGNDPMEFSPIHFPYRGSHLVDNAGNVPLYTSHGTHVTGTIVGQTVSVDIDLDGEPIWDMQRAILGVAPGAKVFHYRALFGSTPTSILLASLESTYYDRPDIVNLSLGGGISNPMAIQNIAINNLMLQNPYKTFVISAGNVGSNFYTVGNPGGATKAITVSNLTEQEILVGANLTSNDNVNTVAFSVAGNPSAEWVVQGNGRIINTFSRIPDNDGVYRIFALPNFDSAAATGTEDINIGSAFGPGLVESFVELFMYYGPEALEGAFILARRPADDNTALENASLVAFNPSMIGAPPGIFDVLGGVIFVDGTAPNRTQPRNLFNLPILVPTLMIDNGSGRSLLENILNSDNGYATFTLDGNLVPQIVANTSSRGPSLQSYEIKPDIGAHGENVFSTVPRWTNAYDWENLSWGDAYAFRSGTSMSTPHVAGAVALMIQYSRAKHTQWNSQEIKSRIMNTAINLDYSDNNYGVFDGARQIDVWAAVQADTIVYVSYPWVATVPGIPFEWQPFETTKTGSFSFGGFNRFGDNGSMSESLVATIANNSSQTRTYTISHEFITTGRSSLSGATLSHPATVTVAANNTADFVTTLNIPANDAIGHYEGFVIVSFNNEVVARLPFAGVAVYKPPTVYNVRTYRPVISTSPNAQNVTSSELVISYTPNFGFSANMHLVRAVPGINEHNWDSSEFEHAVLGTVGNSRFFSAASGHIVPGEPLRGVIFNGFYTPVNYNEPIILSEEGDFYIVMEIWRQSPNLNNAWAWEQNILVPFSVDNTPPVFNSLSINGFEIDVTIVNNNIHHQSLKVDSFNNSNDIVITGNVYDEWLAQAIAKGKTFDIWLETMDGSPETINPFGPKLSKSNNLALWVLVGENEPGNRPILAEIDSDGNFTVTLSRESNENITEISLWLIDGYAPVPTVNQVPFGTNPWNAPSSVRAIFDAAYFFQLPGGAVWVSDALSLFTRNERIFGWAAMPGVPLEAHGWQDWSGLNVTEVNITLVHEAPRFSLNVFNNGTINNQSLADSGLVRIWTQLDGVNSLIPFSGLEVTAVYQGGCAMEYVRINQIWNAPDYVNLIDVNFNAPWQQIYMTFTLFGQTIELVLINPRPPIVPVFSLNVFNNGIINNQSLASAGVIRIWTQLDGVNSLIPFSGLEVTAVYQGGCAMEYVRINQIWNAPDYVNLIDVNFHAPWQQIYMTFTLFGQTIELTLINPQS